MAFPRAAGAAPRALGAAGAEVRAARPPEARVDTAVMDAETRRDGGVAARAGALAGFAAPRAAALGVLLAAPLAELLAPCLLVGAEAFAGDLVAFVAAADRVAGLCGAAFFAALVRVAGAGRAARVALAAGFAAAVRLAAVAGFAAFAGFAAALVPFAAPAGAFPLRDAEAAAVFVALAAFFGGGVRTGAIVSS